MRLNEIVVYLFSIFIGVLLFLLYLFLSSFFEKDNLNKKNIFFPPEPETLIDYSFVVTNPPQKIYFLNSNLNVSARSYLVYDLSLDKEIGSYNKDLTLPPASLVKMISALVFYPKINLEEKYTIDESCTKVEGQKTGFLSGEKVSGKDLIFSSLIFSSADSVCQMQKSSGLTVADLNFFAQNSLDMKSSSFTNFIGLDYGNSYTTASDFLKATKVFLKNKTLSEAVNTRDYILENSNTLKNTNKLLFEIPNSMGVKTGTTALARENLIYRYTDKDKEQDFLIIVLNSPDRYSDTKTLLYGITN